VIFATVWEVYGLPQLGHESMTSLLSFSPTNVLIHQHYSLSEMRVGERCASYFMLTDDHLIKYLSSTVNRIAVTALLLTSSLNCC